MIVVHKSVITIDAVQVNKCCKLEQIQFDEGATCSGL